MAPPRASVTTTPKATISRVEAPPPAVCSGVGRWLRVPPSGPRDLAELRRGTRSSRDEQRARVRGSRPSLRRPSRRGRREVTSPRRRARPPCRRARTRRSGSTRPLRDPRRRRAVHPPAPTRRRERATRSPGTICSTRDLARPPGTDDGGATLEHLAERENCAFGLRLLTEAEGCVQQDDRTRSPPPRSAGRSAPRRALRRLGAARAGR